MLLLFLLQQQSSLANSLLNNPQATLIIITLLTGGGVVNCVRDVYAEVTGGDYMKVVGQIYNLFVLMMLIWLYFFKPFIGGN